MHTLRYRCKFTHMLYIASPFVVPYGVPVGVPFGFDEHVSFSVEFGFLANRFFGGQSLLLLDMDILYITYTTSVEFY